MNQAPTQDKSKTYFNKNKVGLMNQTPTQDKSNPYRIDYFPSNNVTELLNSILLQN